MIGTDGTEKEKKMKRTQKWLSFAAGMLLILMFGAISAAAEEGDRTQTLRSNLEESGFYVQQGLFRELDTVKLASEGKLMSCFGNNAGSAYVVFSLPAAPEQRFTGWDWRRAPTLSRSSRGFHRQQIRMTTGIIWTIFQSGPQSIV